MADEQMEGNSPAASTSEATPPPHDSPEMVGQPSPTEEQVSSTTDGTPPAEHASPPPDPDWLDYSGPSRRISENISAYFARNEEAMEAENPSNISSESSSNNEQDQPDEPPNPTIRIHLEAPPGLPRRDEQTPPPVSPTLITTEQLAEALKSQQLQETLGAAWAKAAGDQAGSSQEISKDSITRKKSDDSDSNQQFDVEEVSTESKSSPENADVRTDSSPAGIGTPEEEMDSESGATKDGVESVSAPDIAVREKESLSKLGFVEKDVLEGESSPSKASTISTSGDAGNVGLKGELSSKPGTSSTSGDVGLFDETSLQNAGPSSKSDVGLIDESSPQKASTSSTSGDAGNVGKRDKLSPSKTGASSVDKSVSEFCTPERGQDSTLKKRKSPTKLDYPFTKKSAPFPSTSGSQSQGESHMSTLLEELDIKGTENKPGCSKQISGNEQEQSLEMETDESQQQDMEVQETDSEKDLEETKRGDKNEDSETEESD